MMLKKIYWWLFIVRLSLSRMRGLNLGDLVIHDGREWVLVQGVARPRWDLRLALTFGLDLGELAKPLISKNLVHESEFKKVRSIGNYWHSFRSAYKFYMTNWYDIWCRDGIKPWMRGCNIWGNTD